MKKIPVYLSEDDLNDIIIGLEGGWKEGANVRNIGLKKLHEKLTEQLLTFKELDGPDYENDEIRNIKPDIVFKPVD